MHFGSASRFFRSSSLPFRARVVSIGTRPCISGLPSAERNWASEDTTAAASRSRVSKTALIRLRVRAAAALVPLVVEVLSPAG